jgi:thiamine biosynthesis lipoprotein
MYYRNTENKKLRIGLENPQNTSEVIGVVELCNQSICGSATNRRTWGKYHHIMNPTTLHSVHDIQATWVIADTALLADALSTCLFLVKPEVLLAHYNFEYVVIENDMSIRRSAHLPGELFYQ